MPTEVSGGSQALVVSTPSTVVNATTTQGNYQFKVDLSNIADGDTLKITIKAKLRSSSSSETVLVERIFVNAQAEMHKACFPFTSLGSVSAILEITAGSNRTVEWSLEKL